MGCGMKSVLLKLTCLIVVLTFNLTSANAAGLRDCELDETQKDDSIIEHVYGGAPDDSDLFPRRAYVLAYNKKWRVPKWAAWYATKAYRDTPERESRWSSFRTDPEIPTVRDNDYVDWYDSEHNFARGHIVPFFISGGDRDHDGIDGRRIRD